MIECYTYLGKQMSPQDIEDNGNNSEQNLKVNNQVCSGLSYHVLCWNI